MLVILAVGGFWEQNTFNDVIIESGFCLRLYVFKVSCTLFLILSITLCARSVFVSRVCGHPHFFH